MSGFPINPPRTPFGTVTGKEVFVTPDWYRFFAQVQKRIGSGADPLGASQFLTLDYNDGLGAERKFTPVSGELTGVDGGENGPYTLGLADTAVIAGSYGDASNLVSITVDAKGRVTGASTSALNSDNVTEGLTNLFFTTARSRASVSASPPLSYNSGTGVFSVIASALTKTDDTNVTLTLGGSPSTCLLAATSLTLGWTGTLSVARGGTGGGTASGTLLDNITGFASTGHLVRTAAGSYAFRAQTGTAGQIDVTNGSGVSGNPTFSISASYVGQTSITTLGTITTGTWNGTTVAVANGGTGVTTATGTSSVVRATQPQFTNTIGVGTAASASGSGVSFPATQDASTDANTLDDYEEGTWTPTVTAGSGTLTTVSGSGYYTKIGRHVFTTVVIDITTNGTGATYIRYTLPFTAAASAKWIGVGRELNSTGSSLTATLSPSGASAVVYTYNNAYPGGTGYQLAVTLDYFV